MTSPELDKAEPPERLWVVNDPKATHPWVSTRREIWENDPLCWGEYVRIDTITRLETELAASREREMALERENERLQRAVDYEAGEPGTVQYHKALFARMDAAEAEVKRLREAIDFTARTAWRTDPPNATGKLTDGERLSAIKRHPTIKEAGKPHAELAEREARALATTGLQGGGDNG